MAHAASSACPDMSLENAEEEVEGVEERRKGLSCPGRAIAARWNRLCPGTSLSSLVEALEGSFLMDGACGGSGLVFPSKQSLTCIDTCYILSALQHQEHCHA